MVLFGMVLYGRSPANFVLLVGLILIAVFIWFMGGRELVMVRLRHGAFPLGPRVPGAGNGQVAWSASWESAPEAATLDPSQARPPIEHASGHPGARGISDAEIESSERFRGSLKRWRRPGA